MAGRGNIAGTVIRLFLLSLVVGLVLSVFNVTPQQLLQRLGGSAERLFEVAVSALEWAVPFVLVGAVIVVPLWLLRAVLRIARDRKP